MSVDKETAHDNHQRREQVIAALLWYGTLLASLLIGAGICLNAFPKIENLVPLGISGYSIVKAGISLFILLPIARVILMLVTFISEQDYRYAAISAIVLAIIAAGILIAV